MPKLKTKILIVIAALLPAVAFCQTSKPSPKTVDLSLSFADASVMRDCLAKLDGYHQLDADKKDVLTYYQFPGHLRVAISDDLELVATAIASYQSAGQTILKQVGGVSGVKLTDAQTAQLNALWADATAVQKKITFETLSDSDLNIDQNPIPSTIWAILKPIRVP
jgi:hypothetical protein